MQKIALRIQQNLRKIAKLHQKLAEFQLCLMDLVRQNGDNNARTPQDMDGTLTLIFAKLETT